jgi:dTDP-4-dehydrorhamnose reductase
LGETEVATGPGRHAILRTAWVYAPFGSNFVRTMLRLAASRDEVGVVADQRGCPTAAHDIAKTLIDVAIRMIRDPQDAALTGVFHMAAQGEAVWADVAEAVFECSARLGGPSARVRRITTADYPTPARRPQNSRLDCSKLRDVYGISLPPWRVSLEDCVTRLVREMGEA